MYVFDAASRDAWKALLCGYGQALCDATPGSERWTDGRLDVRHDCEDASYRSSSMLIGHTCGYPYVKRWASSHQPVSVPVFDITGCNGRHYSSWFVCRGTDSRQSLGAFRHARVAVNNSDSNSGMNVLRYAISALPECEEKSTPFFDSVIETGGHGTSLQQVAEGSADIAAIDAVSHHHLLRVHPDLGERTRVLSQSVFSPGLPFVMHRAGPSIDWFHGSGSELSTYATAALNTCLAQLDSRHRITLRINHFEPVTGSDYQPILTLEETAKDRGYSELR